MSRMIIVWMILISSGVWGVFAQDGEEVVGEAFDLPTALYILSNEGIVRHYGVGISGIHDVTPEDQFVIDFGIASDGRWLAYRTQSGLFIRDLANLQTASIPLEGQATVSFPPYRRGGQTIAWSPNGSTLAYTTEYGIRVVFDVTANRQQYADIAVSPLQHLIWSADGAYLATQADGDIWWIYRRDGYTMTLAGVIPSSVGVAWLDNVRLVFAPAEGGLYILDLANQNEQVQIQPDSRFYRYPTIAPDGSLLAFTFVPSDGLEENYAYWRRLVIDGANVEIEDTSELAIDLTGFRWLPNAELALIWRGGGLQLLIPANGQSIDLMLAGVVGFGWADVLKNPVDTLPIDGYFLADDATGIRQVWRINADQTPEPLTYYETDVNSFAISRDNNQLALSVGGAIWLLDLRDVLAEPVQLMEVLPSATDLEFSADGGMLFYTDAEGVRRVPTVLDEHSAIGLLLMNSETITYHHPQYAPNINALMVLVESNVRQIAFFDLFSEALLMLGTYDDATWVSDGRIIAWKNGVNGAQVVLIDPSIDPPGMITLATFEDEHIYAMRQIDVANFRFVLAKQGLKVPNLMRIANVPITGEEAITQTIFPTVSDPVLSRNGEFVVGVYGFDRQLTLAETAQTLLFPLQTKSFWWGR
jgi:hypothetical protein